MAEIVWLLVLCGASGCVGYRLGVRSAHQREWPCSERALHRLRSMRADRLN